MKRASVEKTILDNIDTDYSYKLAKRMEEFKSNEVLGYRTAGSKAEYDTGEMLFEEMKRIGITDVTKDEITVDKWEFKKAELKYTTEEGREELISLGSYQTHFVTDGFSEYELLYAGKGTADDMDGLDVSGKVVLVEINQRDEWWINYPVYQAHLRGVAAVIAVQNGGYAEIDDEALNAQDIAGPEDAPALSISRRDAGKLISLLKEHGSIKIGLCVDSEVTRNSKTYNIVGKIKGRHPDRMVLMSAHYDSYFDGFQDDNTAVAMMLGIARTFILSGYRPENTIVVCAMAAEEWGVCDSYFDWSTGAYEEIFTRHPEWAGQVIADLNFELPALAHGTRARIRSCYEYVDYLNEFLDGLCKLTIAYPEETRITAPIETWSDDFSMAIAGVPSMVNDFTGGSFMETHYHSQFDNDDFYDEKVYRLHHELFAMLILNLDNTAVIPLSFTHVLERIMKSDGSRLSCNDDELKQKLDLLCERAFVLSKRSKEWYMLIKQKNQRFAQLRGEGRTDEAEELFNSLREEEKKLLRMFKEEQDELVRIDWYGNVFYPQEILIEKINLLSGAQKDLSENDISRALRRIYQIDNNAYAFMFDREVYDHFTEYVKKQPKSRLKWGYNRLMGHEHLYDTVKSLLSKQDMENPDCTTESEYIGKICEEQKKRLNELIDNLINRMDNYGK